MFVNQSYNLMRVETASDTVDFLHGTCDALYVGGAGAATVVLDNVDSDTVLISGIPAGTILPIKVKRVNSSATNASLFVALYHR